jgi:chemotaxis response regulator CheB
VDRFSNTRAFHPVIFSNAWSQLWIPAKIFHHSALETPTLLVANSVILTAHIGQALTTHQFNDWQVVQSAAEVTYLATKLSPKYIIIDVSMVESNIASYCSEIADTGDVAIILMLSHGLPPQTTADVAVAREQCEKIIAVFDFPVEVEKLVAFMADHRTRRKAIDALSPAKIAGKDFIAPQAVGSSGVAQWIQDHPDIVSCAILNSGGQVTETYGIVERGQSEAAHYILAIGRSLGENLGLSHVLAAHHHGPQQKFLTLDAGDHIAAFNCKPKAVLRDIAARHQS